MVRSLTGNLAPFKSIAATAPRSNMAQYLYVYRRQRPVIRMILPQKNTSHNTAALGANEAGRLSPAIVAKDPGQPVDCPRQSALARTIGESEGETACERSIENCGHGYRAWRALSRRLHAHQPEMPIEDSAGSKFPRRILAARPRSSGPTLNRCRAHPNLPPRGQRPGRTAHFVRNSQRSGRSRPGMIRQRSL